MYECVNVHYPLYVSGNINLNYFDTSKYFCESTKARVKCFKAKDTEKNTKTCQCKVKRIENEKRIESNTSFKDFAPKSGSKHLFHFDIGQFAQLLSRDYFR